MAVSADVTRATPVLFLLLVLLIHSEGARTLERHATAVSEHSCTNGKHQPTNKSLHDVNFDDRMGYLPPTTPGCSPGIGHC